MHCPQHFSLTLLLFQLALTTAQRTPQPDLVPLQSIERLTLSRSGPVTTLRSERPPPQLTVHGPEGASLAIDEVQCLNLDYKPHSPSDSPSGAPSAPYSHSSAHHGSRSAAHIRSPLKASEIEWKCRIANLPIEYSLCHFSINCESATPGVDDGWVVQGSCVFEGEVYRSSSSRTRIKSRAEKDRVTTRFADGEDDDEGRTPWGVLFMGTWIALTGWVIYQGCVNRRRDRGRREGRGGNGGGDDDADDGHEGDDFHGGSCGSGSRGGTMNMNRNIAIGTGVAAGVAAGTMAARALRSRTRSGSRSRGYERGGGTSLSGQVHSSSNFGGTTLR